MLCLAAFAWAAGACRGMEDVVVQRPRDAGPLVRLAGSELRRYGYLRTGGLWKMAESAGPADAIVLARDASGLAAEEFIIRSDASRGRTAITISGGGDAGVLYGAYRYAELLGVRFYLHGDVVPDERLGDLPAANESGKPLFKLRGVNPWGSHPFGFDAWSADDYKAIATQLAKMRMNFFGIHCYPEGRPYAEPTVWHGLSGDFDTQGRVTHSYVTRYFNTLLGSAWGGYRAKRTGDYSFGGALLFAGEAWAPDVMRGHCPLPATPEGCNDVFNRVGAQFRDAFALARQLGVKTCVGTEAPLVLPKGLAKRTADVRAVYEGTFRRIMASHPLDYYWLWTPESWTWSGNKPAQYSETVADIKLAIEALRNVGAPFQLATAGWVLGPQHDRAAFDRDLPRNIPLSALSRNTGAAELDPAFGRIAGREKWAIPWLESDNRQGLAGVQLEVGRVRRDAADARAYGCTGLMGLHWRTDAVAPAASALAHAAWDQSWRRAGAWTIPGQAANYPSAAIAGTQDAPLYRSCRYDLGTIRLAAPPGKYRVTLKFCEPHFKSAGERICDVLVQGRTVLASLDIFAKVGQFAALDCSFDDVAVTDGTLSIELVARKSLPCISAIAVEGPGFASKINCGGAAYKDWQADAAGARAAPVDDFYADWARANLGLAEAGKVFAALDGKVPQVTDGGCPSGSLTPVKTPWDQLAPQFAFVDELERLRPKVKGAGNLDRFDYWLNSFKYIRALAQLRCALARPDAAELTRLYADAYRHLLATVNTPGGLAMVVNMESHPGWGPAVARHAAQPWPKEYQGQPRLIVPTVRSVANKGEALNLRIIALAATPFSSVLVRVRPLGRGDWQTVTATHLARSVYEAKLPAALEDFEYHIAAGDKLVWPATAPGMNQTVVVME
ncbi:MAG: hypothetical protein FJ291_06830 [Planctomycetes bacterium]|nr:hypothetical protein [Planctomycetota bacterium]